MWCLYFLHNCRKYSAHLKTFLIIDAQPNIFFQGGIKAVVFTDAWQVIVMFIAVVVVVMLGTSMVGGISTVFDRATAGGRIQIFK